MILLLTLPFTRDFLLDSSTGERMDFCNNETVVGMDMTEVSKAPSSCSEDPVQSDLSKLAVMNGGWVLQLNR